MATWNSRGLRGSTLEEFINHSNERYSEMGLALMQKIPTPITPVILETAAINNRQKEMGYNAAKELLTQLGLADDITK